MTTWAPGSVYACCLIKITSHTGVIKENQFPNSFLQSFAETFLLHSSAGVVRRLSGCDRIRFGGPQDWSGTWIPVSHQPLPRLIEVNLIHNSARHAQLCDCSNVMKNELQSQSLWWRFKNSSELDNFFLKKATFSPVRLVIAKRTTDKIQ